MNAPDQLHVIRCYERLPPLPGGMEQHIAELTAAQRLIGVRVTEMFNQGGASGEAIQVWRGLTLDKLKPYLFRSALFYAAAALRHLDFADQRLRVVHIHGDWPAFLFGSMFGRLIGANAIAASLHATTHTSISRYAWALRRCDPIFATGAKQAAQLSQAIGRPVIHLPSAPSEIFFRRASPASKFIDVVAIGSLVPVKNLGLLLDCAARRPDLSFMILGSGPEERALRRKASMLRLQNVQFGGASTLEEVRRVLHSARVFINTSLTEGSPTAVLEAMACGLPAVLTPSNDYSHLVDQGINGWVTASWDADELIQAIDGFLTNPTRLDVAARAARDKAERHHWVDKAKIVTDAMIDVVQRDADDRS
jgi:glycosyltransferase involved in cell wall biosynthesis